MGNRPRITILYGFRRSELDIPDDYETSDYYDKLGLDIIYIFEDYYEESGFVAFGINILWDYGYELQFESIEKYAQRLPNAKHKLNALLSKHPEIRKLVKDVEPQVIISLEYD